MNFKEACESINAAFMLTDKEKSKLIGKVREGDQSLFPILQSWKNSGYQNGEELYDQLKAKKLIGYSNFTTPMQSKQQTPQNRSIHNKQTPNQNYKYVNKNIPSVPVLDTERPKKQQIFNSIEQTPNNQTPVNEVRGDAAREYVRTVPKARPPVPTNSNYGYHESTGQFISEKNKPLGNHSSIVEVKPVAIPGMDTRRSARPTYTSNYQAKGRSVSPMTKGYSHPSHPSQHSHLIQGTSRRPVPNINSRLVGRSASPSYVKPQYVHLQHTTQIPQSHVIMNQRNPVSGPAKNSYQVAPTFIQDPNYPQNILHKTKPEMKISKPKVIAHPRYSVASNNQPARNRSKMQASHPSHQIVTTNQRRQDKPLNAKNQNSRSPSFRATTPLQVKPQINAPTSPRSPVAHGNTVQYVSPPRNRSRLGNISNANDSRQMTHVHNHDMEQPPVRITVTNTVNFGGLRTTQGRNPLERKIQFDTVPPQSNPSHPKNEAAPIQKQKRSNLPVLHDNRAPNIHQLHQKPTSFRPQPKVQDHSSPQKFEQVNTPPVDINGYTRVQIPESMRVIQGNQAILQPQYQTHSYNSPNDQRHSTGVPLLHNVVEVFSPNHYIYTHSKSPPQSPRYHSVNTQGQVIPQAKPQYISVPHSQQPQFSSRVISTSGQNPNYSNNINQPSSRASQYPRRNSQVQGNRSVHPSTVQANKVIIKDDQFIPQSKPEVNNMRQNPDLREFKGERVIDARHRHPKPEPTEQREKPKSPGRDPKNKHLEFYEDIEKNPAHIQRATGQEPNIQEYPSIDDINAQLNADEQARVADPIQGKKMAELKSKSNGDGQNPNLIQPAPNEITEKQEENKPVNDSGTAKTENQPQAKSKPQPLIIKNPEVKDKPETKLMKLEQNSTLQKIMAIRRDLSLNEVPPLKMAKTLHDGLVAAEFEKEGEKPKQPMKKTEDPPKLSQSLNSEQFKKTMAPLKPEHLDDKTYNDKLSALFKLLDLNQNNQAEISEISNLLILISGGDKQDKIKAAFKFYDLNQNNSLEPSEMVEYIKGVLMLRKAGEKSSKVEPTEEAENKKLAAAMVAKCFKDYGIDLSKNDQPVRGLNYKQFSQWVLNNGSGYTAKQG